MNVTSCLSHIGPGRAPPRPGWSAPTEVLAMNAISLITKDHRSVEQQYARFQQAAKDRRHGIAEKIIHDLSGHAAMAEMRLYPALRQHLGRVGDAYADRSLKEHAAVTEKLARLEAE